MSTGPAPRARVLRVIARMNVGGPAHHVALLSGRLPADRYETLLVAGDIGRGEASAEDLADRHGAHLVRLRFLGPGLDPVRDLRALGGLVRLIRHLRPDIVHTHTAKAGALGRTAAVLAGAPRPVIVHTYHGHVLRGYFGPVVTGLYRRIERSLGRVSDRLVAVSDAVATDLVALGVAPPAAFTVISLGLDLSAFLALPEEPGGPVRRELAVTDDEVLALFAGRLAPIKRVDVLLRGLAGARRTGAPVRLLIAGDGEERPALESLATDLGLADAVRFLGYRRDLADLVHAADLAVLTSDNEGTPVALIEAAAGARPALATDVGGVADIVGPGQGRLVPPGNPAAFGAALAELAADRDGLRRMGTAARNAVGRYSADRLIADVDLLYAELLTGRGA